MEAKNGNTDTIVDDFADLQKYIKDVTERNILKSQLIKANQTANASSRPDDSFFRKLDSSMKKTRAFVRKLKTINSATSVSMQNEFDGLNLSQYTGEMAAALCESKRKMDDVMSAVEICTLISVRYEDFAGHLYESITKMLLSRKESKISNPTLYRVNLRFFSELVGVWTFPERGLSFLMGQLNLITSMDLDSFNNIAILSAFTKFCGLDFLGLHHRSIRMASVKYNLELPSSCTLNADKQRSALAVMRNYFEHLLKFVREKHVELCNTRRQNNQILQTRGELSTERTEKFNVLSNYFDCLIDSSKSFANYIDQEFPEFDDPNEKTEESVKHVDTNGNDLVDDFDVPVINSPWYIDEDMRNFYEQFPDLTKMSTPWKQEVKHSEVNTDELSTICDSIEIKLTDEVTNELTADSNEFVQEAEEPVELMESVDELAKPEDDPECPSSGIKYSFNDFISRLGTSLNREMIDKAAEEFCLNLNTRVNRKKLARSIFNVNRTRYDLLPLYARLVKILYPVMPDVGTELVEHLKKDFLWQLKVKNQINIESKLRSVRLIAELTKFNVMSPDICLNCLKVLIHDFSYHNIEMACAILESCGRFLYCHPEAHQRAKVYLEWIIQKKSHLHLDTRYVLMIENAYYATKPPEIVAHKPMEELPPHFQYVQCLLQSEFSKGVVESVAKKLCKYDWNDEKTFDFIVSCFVEVWRYKFGHLHYISGVLACIEKMGRKTNFHVVVVDRLFEGIKLGLEARNPSWKQRMVAMVRMVGELNSCGVVDCDAICDTFYSLLRYGLKYHYLRQNVSSFDEMRDCLFRIRLVCILLDSVYRQFSNRNQLMSFYGRRLDYFVIVFRKYFWLKHSDKIWDEDNQFPSEIYSLFRDSTDLSFVDLPVCNSLEEAGRLYQKLSSSMCRVNSGGRLPDLAESSRDYSPSKKLKEAKIKEIENKRLESIRMQNDKNDTDFVKAFEKMVAESTVPRQLERVKMPVSEISNLATKSNGRLPDDSSAVECRLLTRKGKKQQQISMLVDKKTKLGNKFVTQQEESKREDKIMKNVVMKIHERQQQEDQNGVEDAFYGGDVLNFPVVRGSDDKKF